MANSQLRLRVVERSEIILRAPFTWTLDDKCLLRYYWGLRFAITAHYKHRFTCPEIKINNNDFSIYGQPHSGVVQAGVVTRKDVQMGRWVWKMKLWPEIKITIYYREYLRQQIMMAYLLVRPPIFLSIQE